MKVKELFEAASVDQFKNDLEKTISVLKDIHKD